jgi:hypothetical protein
VVWVQTTGLVCLRFLNDDVFRRKSSAEALQALVTPKIFEGIAIRSLKNIKGRNNE